MTADDSPAESAPPPDATTGPGATGSATEPAATAEPPAPPRAPRRRRERLDDRDLAERFPYWGPATLSLLVIGVGVGFFTLGTTGRDAIKRCAALANAAVCDPRTEGLVLALPVLATGLGLVISLIGGRILIRRQRSPMVAAGIGWGLFVIAVVIAYGAGGRV